MIYLQPNQWTNSDSINAYALQMSTGKYIMDSANEPWSFYSPDNYVLRFEVRPGDHWFVDPYGSERAEIGGTTQYANGTPINVSYSFKVEPGATNTSKWLVLGQLHQNDYDGETSASPPVAIAMIGEKLAVQIGWTDSAGINHDGYIYTSATNIIRGQYYNMNIAANINPQGIGQLVVMCNGQTLARYTGPLGIKGHSSVFWKEGIYEFASPQTMAVDYKNLNIFTGGEFLSSSSTPALPSGASSISYAYASSNALSVETVMKWNKSKDVYTHNTVGRNYVTTYRGYDSTGKLVVTINYNTNGTHSYALTTNADGSVTSDYYDSGGHATKSVTTYTSGSISTLIYANNAIVEHFVQNPDGSTADARYGPTGATTKIVNTYANGTKSSSLYGVTGANYSTQTTLYNASGAVTSIVRANAAGIVVFSETVTAKGTTTANFSSAGLLSTVRTAYIGGPVSSLVFSNGQLVERYIAYGDGSALDIRYNSSGVATSIVQVDAKDSQNVLLNATAANTVSPKIAESKGVQEAPLLDDFGADTFTFTSAFGNAVIDHFQTSGMNHDLLQFSAALVPTYSSLAIEQSGSDTLVSVDSHDSVRLVGVIASSFNQADVKFV